jgi:hypothetical protein
VPTTPNYAFPYPALSDPPNVPADMQALAVATDTALQGIATPNGTYAEYRKGAGQTITTSLDTLMGFGTTTVSSSLVTRTAVGLGHYFTLNRAGTWQIAVGPRWTLSSAAGERSMVISTDVSPTADRMAPDSGGAGTTGLFALVRKPFPVNQRIGVWLWQATGADLAIDNTIGDNRITFEWCHN